MERRKEEKGMENGEKEGSINLLKIIPPDIIYWEVVGVENLVNLFHKDSRE